MELIEVVRVKFRWPGKIFEFVNRNKLVIKKNDKVLVRGSDGSTLIGTISIEPRIRQKRKEDSELTEIIRHASEQELKLNDVNDDFRLNVRRFFQTRIQSREISGVKFIDCEVVDSGRKLIIYYSSEQRKFDYRNLSKEVARKFGLKADLRPVGVRDAARVAGGIGKCGLSQCCSTWLTDFNAVSIKMAKDQGVSLEPEGINGQCGRLLCCLGYEHENYLELGHGIPKVGKAVVTPLGDARVVKLDILKGLITVKTESGNFETFKKTEVARKFGPGSQAPSPKKEGSEDKKPSPLKEKKEKAQALASNKKTPSEHSEKDKDPSKSRPQKRRRNRRNSSKNRNKKNNSNKPS